MSFIADLLLAAGAIGAAFYCWILGRRLRRFTDLEHGVGGAVAVLSAQVDDLSKALSRAENAAQGSVSALTSATNRAQSAAQDLELMLSSMHDLPGGLETKEVNNPFFVCRNSAEEASR